MLDLPRRVTAADVAREASVSVATVSLVVNDRWVGRISSSTVERVQAAIERLGYRVDALARVLSTGRRGTVALIAPDITNPFFSWVTMGIVAVLGSDYQLFLVVSDPEGPTFEACAEAALALKPAGILVDSPSAALVRTLRPDCPLVLLDTGGVHTDETSVVLDVESGASQLAEHLLDLGHQQFAYIDGATLSPTFLQRRRALGRRLHNGITDFPSGRIILAEVDIHVAARAFKRAWPVWKKSVTAIVCATDLHAYGVLRAARELGVRVPHDISLGSFDDLPFSALTEPPLTTVKLPAYELGMESAKVLRQIIEADAVASSPVSVLLPTSLVVRESTAAARGSR